MLELRRSPSLLLIVDVSSDWDSPAATAAELTFPTMNPSTKMLDTRFGVGEGGAMLPLVVVVLALVLLLVVVDLLGVVAVIFRVVRFLTVVDVFVGAVDVEVVVNDEGCSVVIAGFNLFGSGAFVFLLGNFGAGAGVVFCVRGDSGLGQRVVFFVGFSVVVVVVVTGKGLDVGKRVGYGPALGFAFGLFVIRLRSEMKKLNMLSSEDSVVVVVGRAVVAVTIGGKVNGGGFLVGVGLEFEGRESGLITEGGGRGRLSSKSHGRVVLAVVNVGAVVRGAEVAVLFLLDEDVPLLGGWTAGGGVGYAGLLNPLVKAVSEAAGE